MKNLFEKWFNELGEDYGGALPAFELIEAWSEAAFKAGMLAAAEIAKKQEVCSSPRAVAYTIRKVAGD